MDETLRELVSRYLDGDLSEVEARGLERRAEDNAELAGEIDTTHRLREAVAAVAETMDPPAALDNVLMPLCQAAPAPPRRVRPVYRWLGAAAALVLGVTVAVEVARRNPEPTLRRSSPTRDQTAVDRREVFELAPLPTAQPDPDRPLGAEDRLLNEEPAEPSVPEPRPLEVMGPLPADEPSIATDLEVGSTDQKVLADDEGAEEMVEETLVESKMESPASLGAVAQAKETTRADAPAPPGKDLPLIDGERQAAAGRASAVGGKGRRQEAVSARVVIHIDGIEVLSGRSTDCLPGSWRVLVEVRDRKVVSLKPLVGDVDDELDRFDDGCRPENLFDSTLTGVADGIHTAEIVVHHPSR